MAREVTWTDPAWEDLEAAAEYIARDSEAYAAAFVEKMKAAATSLSEMGERGQDPRDHPWSQTSAANLRPRITSRSSGSGLALLAPPAERDRWAA